jgi:hypothetical protein
MNNSTSASPHATPQAGVFSGENPSAVNTADPIVLFIIQVSI